MYHCLDGRNQACDDDDDDSGINARRLASPIPPSQTEVSSPEARPTPTHDSDDTHPHTSVTRASLALRWCLLLLSLVVTTARTQPPF